MKHLIRQQYLHVEVTGTESDGLALQAMLTALCQQELLPALEQALNRYAPPQGHLVIGHLEIDVGHLRLDRLNQDLAGAVQQALEKELQKHIPAGEAQALAAKANTALRSDLQAVEEAFIYYLHTGRLPWSFRPLPGRDLAQALLDAWQQEPARAAPADLPRALADAYARKRLTSQFSADFLNTFLARFYPEGSRAMRRIGEKLAATIIPDRTSRYLKELEKQLWESVLERLAGGSSLTEKALVGEAWHRMPPPPPGASSLARLLEKYWPGATGPAPLASERAAGQPDVTAGDGPSPLSPASRPASPIDESGADMETRSGFYIDNAGLVLLHPFLPRFFEHLGVVAAGNMLKPDHALALLHYLATGQSDAPEYELTLPKILCQVPLEKPLETKVVLAEAEKEEAAALLEALIRHWKALRNTSSAGLRDTFLIRPGKLSRRADGDWLLQVESKSYDILLDQLPWGIAMISLPWMKPLLWVEWNS